MAWQLMAVAFFVLGFFHRLTAVWQRPFLAHINIEHMLNRRGVVWRHVEQAKTVRKIFNKKG